MQTHKVKLESFGGAGTGSGARRSHERWISKADVGRPALLAYNFLRARHTLLADARERDFFPLLGRPV